MTIDSHDYSGESPTATDLSARHGDPDNGGVSADQDDNSGDYPAGVGAPYATEDEMARVGEPAGALDPIHAHPESVFTRKTTPVQHYSEQWKAQLFQIVAGYPLLIAAPAHNRKRCTVYAMGGLALATVWIGPAGTTNLNPGAGAVTLPPGGGQLVLSHPGPVWAMVDAATATGVVCVIQEFGPTEN